MKPRHDVIDFYALYNLICFISHRDMMKTDLWSHVHCRIMEPLINLKRPTAIDYELCIICQQVGPKYDAIFEASDKGWQK